MDFRHSRRGRRAAAVAATGVAGMLALSGCGTQLATFVLGDASEAVVTSNPAIGLRSVDPDQPIVVKAEVGQLTHVSVIGAKGKPVEGTIDPTRTTWTSTVRTMAFGTEYKIQAAAVDSDGLESSFNNSFTTIRPTNTFDAHVISPESQEVGVGMPLRIEFSRPVKDKAEIENHIDVYSGKPVVGAWSWNADSTVATFRPEKFWPGHNNVAVHARMRGAQAAKGIYGTKDFTFKFSTGASMVSTVDADTYQMTVVRDGKKVETIPITTGKPGFETRSGTKVIMSKDGTVRMSDPTLRGTGEYYDLTVSLAMRITPSGEYLHAAPWSTGSQGRANVSHGCVGMSTGNASWLYSNSLVGDVVIVKNSGRPQDLDNGITDWNIPWRQWLKRSATGAKTVGPGPLAPAPAKRRAAAVTANSPKSGSTR